MYKRYIQNFHLSGESEFYDVVVVGAGAAGLFASLTLNPELKILVIAKEGLRDCNSQLAQGGIAITLDEDYESHVVDTLKAGSYYNDEAVVRKMIRMSQPVFDELITLGAQFDKNEDGSIAKTAEGGHRKRRIIHSKDVTGEAVMTALIDALPARENIRLMENAFAVDIITEGVGSEADTKQVVGLVYRDAEGLVQTVGCRNIILATGGIGGLFESTTNVDMNKGDGIAMALRAGAVTRDAEFIQFHPTAMALKTGGYFLISEAVRGEGGHLINDLGQRFMEGKHELKELAPRDIVAKAINDEKLLGRKVFVDVTHFATGTFPERFPNIYKHCLENGIDPLKEPIPVTPVEHYYMGGISCNSDGQVLDDKGEASIQGLFGTGETASTGFHGANRLASNSLLECLTLSLRVTALINGQKMNHEALAETFKGKGLIYRNQGLEISGEALEKDYSSFRKLFSETFTIVKNAERVKETLGSIEDGLKTLSAVQSESLLYVTLYNGLMVAKEIALSSLQRPNSLGAFIWEPEANERESEKNNE